VDWYCENVIHGDLPVDKVYESESVIAFHHTRPFWEHHVVIVPRNHIESIASEEAKDVELMGEIMGVISNIAKEFNQQFGGCHVGTNVGSYQSAKHMHWYVHAGLRVRDREGRLIHKRN